MVGVTGLEPAASRPPDVCATNCATPRLSVKNPYIRRYTDFFGRDDWIWTSGPYVPNVVLYQTEPHPDYGGEGEIWTLAPVTRPTPLAGAPLRPLEYFSVKKSIHTAWLPPSDKQSTCMQIPILNFIGGESGIRTRGRRNRHRFSRPALSTTQTSLRNTNFV